MGIWLMPKTDVFPYAFSFKNDEDYASIIETVQPLILRRVFMGPLQVADGAHEVFTGHTEGRAKLWSGEGVIPREVLDDWMEKHSPLGRCSWVIYGNVDRHRHSRASMLTGHTAGAQYGPKNTTDASIQIIKDALLKIPGARFHTGEDFPESHFFHHKKQVFAGRPTLGELYLLDWTPNGAHLFFSPILPLDPKAAEVILRIVRECMIKYGFDPIPQLMVGPRQIHCLNAILYDTADAGQKKRAFECMQEMIRVAADEGYGEYRYVPTVLLFSFHFWAWPVLTGLGAWQDASVAV